MYDIQVQAPCQLILSGAYRHVTVPVTLATLPDSQENLPGFNGWVLTVSHEPQAVELRGKRARRQHGVL